MTKAELELLEKVFAAEVYAAFTNGMHLVQTRCKVARKLEADGLLREKEIVVGGWPPITVKGYELTHAGRMAYCMTCDS